MGGEVLCLLAMSFPVQLIEVCIHHKSHRILDIDCRPVSPRRTSISFFCSQPIVSLILTYIGDKFLQLQLTCMLDSLSLSLASNASTLSVRACSGSSCRHVRQAYRENLQVIDSSLMVRESTTEEVGCSDSGPVPVPRSRRTVSNFKLRCRRAG